MYKNCKGVVNRMMSSSGKRTRSLTSSRCAFVPNKEIIGQTVLITGAKGGIGLDMARQLLKKKNVVIVASRGSSAQLDKLAKSYSVEKYLQEMDKDSKSCGSCLLRTELDVSKEDSISEWQDEMKSLDWIDRVDVVINNAGVLIYKGIESVSADAMLTCFKVNTIGPLLVTQALLNSGLIGRKGTTSLVATVSSKVGSIDDNGSGSGYAYRTSKCAVNMVMKSMWIDLDHRGVTCMILHPGYVRTNMTGGNGFIDVEESASGLIKAMEGKYVDITGKDKNEIVFIDYKGKWKVIYS